MQRWKRSLALPVTMVAIALGFLISLQAQTQKNVSAAEQISADRENQMKAVLSNSKAQNEILLEEHRVLSEKLEEARKEVGTDPQLMAQLIPLQMLEGTIAVEGQGVQISIDDRIATGSVLSLTAENIVKLINTLKYAGAEAISINDQRIVGSTDIVLSGTSTILVKMEPINRSEGIPYEVNAIGDPDKLFNFFSELEAKELKDHDMKVSIVKKTTLRIPPYKGAYTFNLAEPEMEQEMEPIIP